MALIKNILAFVALTLLSNLAFALPADAGLNTISVPMPVPTCFSYTSTVPFTGAIHCPKMPVCGPHPDCVLQQKSMIYVPCTNTHCPTTPTVTVTAAPTCHTCQVGCATAIELMTITTGCPTSTQTHAPAGITAI